MIRLTRVASGKSRKYQALVRNKGDIKSRPFLLSVERVTGRAIDPEYPSWIVYVTENSRHRSITSENGDELFNSMHKVRFRINALFDAVPMTWRFDDDDDPVPA